MGLATWANVTASATKRTRSLRPLGSRFVGEVGHVFAIPRGPRHIKNGTTPGQADSTEETLSDTRTCGEGRAEIPRRDV